jgi:hypothetical protein
VRANDERQRLVPAAAPTVLVAVGPDGIIRTEEGRGPLGRRPG